MSGEVFLYTPSVDSSKIDSFFIFDSSNGDEQFDERRFIIKDLVILLQSNDESIASAAQSHLLRILSVPIENLSSEEIIISNTYLTSSYRDLKYNVSGQSLGLLLKRHVLHELRDAFYDEGREKIIDFVCSDEFNEIVLPTATNKLFNDDDKYKLIPTNGEFQEDTNLTQMPQNFAEDLIFLWSGIIKISDTRGAKLGAKLLTLFEHNENALKFLISNLRGSDTYSSKEISNLLKSYVKDNRYYKSSSTDQYVNNRKMFYNLISKSNLFQEFLELVPDEIKKDFIKIDQESDSNLTRDLLLNMLSDIDIPETQDFEEIIKYIIAELKTRPEDISVSLLKLTKAFLLIPDEYFDYVFLDKWEAKKYKEITMAIGMIMYEALKIFPDKFFSEKFVNLLKYYLDSKLNSNLQYRSTALTSLNLSHANQGDSVSEGFSELNSKFLKGDPIVIYVAGGLGDIFMMIPVIQDLLKTTQKLGTKNKITIYLYSDQMISLTGNLLKNYVDDGQLEILSYEKFPQKKDKISSRDFPADKNGQYPTIVISQERNESKFDDDITVYRYFLPQASIYYYGSGKAEIPSTFQTLSDALFSDIFGVAMFEPSNPINNLRLKQLLVEYIQNYLINTNEGIKLKIRMDILKHRDEVKNGYIAIIGQGSNSSKKITPNLAEEIVNQISFCKEHKMGIVYLYDDKMAPEELALIKSIFDNSGIPYELVELKTKPDNNHPFRDDFRYAFAILMNARGVIGPDTFLTHVAEFLSLNSTNDLIGPRAVMNLHADSEPEVFNINPSTIQVQSWFSKLISHFDKVYMGNGGVFIAENLGNLLNPDISTNNPLLQELWREFIKNLEIGFAQWSRQVLGREITN